MQKIGKLMKILVTLKSLGLYEIQKNEMYHIQFTNPTIVHSNTRDLQRVSLSLLMI